MIITSRAAWGAAPARPGVLHARAVVRTEFMLHHSGAGPDQSVAEIQRYCMNPKPNGKSAYLDIDYNFLVRGTTGEIYEGRGWYAIGSHCVGHNTAAWGICVIGTEQLTDAAKASIIWLYGQAVTKAGHPLRVLGHRDAGIATACPGTTLEAWLKTGAVSTRTLTVRLLELTTPFMRGEDVRLIQLKTGAVADGIYGPATAATVRAWQREHGLTPDGIVGPKTRAALGIQG